MTHAGAICKGDFLLGTACGKCEKCLHHIERFEAMRNKMGSLKTSPQEMVITSMLRISSLEEEVEALTLRVNYLADAVYGKQAVAQANMMILV